MGEIGEHHRDIKNSRKAQKKRRRAKRNQQKKHNNQKADLKKGNQPPRRCRDWIILTCGAQYAKNRSSFKTYQRIDKVKLKSGTEVVGRGSVELEVLRSPDSSESHTLVLENVLHIPDALCNGVTIPKGTHDTSFSPIMRGFDEEGRPYWYGDEFRNFSRLALAGNHEGDSPLEDEEAHPGPFYLSLRLDEDEIKMCFFS